MGNLGNIAAFAHSDSGLIRMTLGIMSPQSDDQRLAAVTMGGVLSFLDSGYQSVHVYIPTTRNRIAQRSFASHTTPVLKILIAALLEGSSRNRHFRGLGPGFEQPL